MDSQINFSVVVHGRMQDLSRGANYFFFWGGGHATRDVATGLLGGFMPPKKKILMVQFGAFWSIFSYIFYLKNLKMSFLYKNNYKL